MDIEMTVPPEVEDALEEELGGDHAAEVLESLMDDRKAEWVCNWMARWTQEIARREAAHQRSVNRLKGMINWFQLKYGAHLDLYLGARLAVEKGKRKSVELECGVKLAYRAVAAKITYPDVEETIAWARNANSALYEMVVTERIDPEVVKVLRAAGTLVPNDSGMVVNTGTGEIIPGMAWTEAKDEFYIQLPKPPKKGSTVVDEDADLLQ